MSAQSCNVLWVTGAELPEISPEGKNPKRWPHAGEIFPSHAATPTDRLIKNPWRSMGDFLLTSDQPLKDPMKSH